MGFPPEYDAPLIAATCIYLAGKANEEHVKIRDILNVTHRYVCAAIDLLLGHMFFPPLLHIPWDTRKVGSLMYKKGILYNYKN